MNPELPQVNRTPEAQPQNIGGGEYNVENTSLNPEIGRESERARYFPNHINTELMNVIDMNNIAIETYERGAGYTMANGTGACAAAGVAYKLGLTSNKVIVHMPGGELQVEIGDDWEAYMTGDVFYVAAVKLSSEFVEMLRAV